MSKGDYGSIKTNRLIEVTLNAEEKCPKCSAVVDSKSLFCSQCGAKIERKIFYDTKCIRCGEPLTSFFCKCCGLEYTDDSNGSIILEKRICANCGATIFSEQQFCPKCGTDITHSKLDKRCLSATCPQCKAIVSVDQNFCMTCGKQWKVLAHPIISDGKLQCSACGQGSMQLDRKTCFICGAQFVETPWQCSNCGRKNHYTNHNCYYCGQATGPEQTSPQPNVAKQNWVKKIDKPIVTDTADLGSPTVSENTQRKYSSRESTKAEISSERNAIQLVAIIICAVLWVFAPFIDLHGRSVTALEYIFGDVFLSVYHWAYTPIFWAGLVSFFGIIICFVCTLLKANRGTLGFAIAIDAVFLSALPRYDLDDFGFGFWGIFILLLCVIWISKSQISLTANKQ